MSRRRGLRPILNAPRRGMQQAFDVWHASHGRPVRRGAAGNDGLGDGTEAEVVDGRRARGDQEGRR
jgi:hypothetical protein